MENKLCSFPKASLCERIVIIPRGPFPLIAPLMSVLSLSWFPSSPPESFFCPGLKRWCWYLAHLVEETHASQNKLYNKLLAGWEKLCTHNLLVICKLRSEFAPSSILHLSLPFFYSLPSSPSAAPILPAFFCFFLRVTRKVGY